MIGIAYNGQGLALVGLTIVQQDRKKDQYLFDFLHSSC